MLDCSNTDEIVCPYCKYEFSDSYDVIHDDNAELECPDCKKEFRVDVDRTVTYSSTCTLKNHKYVNDPFIDREDYYTCEHCDNSVFKQSIEQTLARNTERLAAMLADPTNTQTTEYLQRRIDDLTITLSQLT